MVFYAGSVLIFFLMICETFWRICGDHLVVFGGICNDFLWGLSCGIRRIGGTCGGFFVGYMEIFFWDLWRHFLQCMWRYLNRYKNIVCVIFSQAAEPIPSQAVLQDSLLYGPIETHF